MSLASLNAGLRPCALPRRTAVFSGRRLSSVRAGDAPGPIEPSSSTSTSEKRLESFEASIRGKAPKAPAPPTAVKPIRIRGMTAQPENQVDSQYENMAEWKEGQLFPEGWDKMSLGQKMSELYLGRRGMLFWVNKAAYASAIGMLVLWIAFRFVGPSLGLYQLSSDILSPSLQ